MELALGLAEPDGGPVAMPFEECLSSPWKSSIPKKQVSGSRGLGISGVGGHVPLVSHRIAVFLVPKNPDQDLPRELEQALLTELVHMNWVSEEGRAGQASNELIEGGFQRFRVDRPGQPVLYGNRLGGFRAKCPSCGVSVAGSLGGVIERWREQGDRRSSCTSCRERFLLEEWDYAPFAAPGKWALVFTRAEAPAIREEAKECVERWLGFPVVEVVSRG